MKRILIAYGTRPEVIKLAPVIHALEKQGHHPLIINAQQQPALSAQAEAIFNLVPTTRIDLVSDDLNVRLSQIIEDMGHHMHSQIGCVVVQGDTTTALGTTLAAFNRNIPVAHVEAGLRSNDLSAPFPEEGNRKVIDSISRFHFTPTDEAYFNAGGYRVGNTVLDAMLYLGSWHVMPTNRVLITLHRREGINRWDGMREVVIKLHEQRPDLELVIFDHPNPDVRYKHESIFDDVPITRLNSMSYLAFQKELHACQMIMSDSGGLQEEAVILGKPIVILRECTERPEVLRTKIGRLSGFDPSTILNDALELLESHPVPRPDVYGDGKAGEKIANILLSDTL